jgi:hypothetical protein
MSTPFEKTLSWQKSFTVWKLKKIESLKKKKYLIKPRK